MVKTLHFQPRGTGWIPGQLATKCGQEKEKKKKKVAGKV